MLETLDVANMVECRKDAIRECVNILESLTNVSNKEKQLAEEILPYNHEGRGYSTQSDNAEDRDYQQERIRDLVWLGCAFECEGTFTMQYNEMEEEGGLKSYIQPRLIFVNSDLLIVNEVDRLIRKFGFEPYRREGIIGGIGKKKKTELAYLGKKILPLLKMLRPYLVGEKSECADCMIAFIEYRQSLKRKAQQYGDYEFSLFNRVRKINSGHWRRKPKFSELSSETVRQRREEAWKRADAKIQSGLHGDMQSATETIAPPSARKLAQRRRQYENHGR